MRKPKIHPEYGINLVGIQFGTRWNVVSMATKDEIQKFISNFSHIQEIRRSNRRWWDKRLNTANETTQNNYFKKLWRKRYGETLQKDVLYRCDRNFGRWDIKLAPSTGEGSASSYIFTRDQSSLYRISKGDILVMTKSDELGNLYFSKINEISSKHLFVFSNTSDHLSFFVPLKE